MTASQLERWRCAGYLPGNTRAGLGRGAGSRSEIVPGVVDYLEALACLAGQGRSMHQVMLTLFMAGVVQPESCSTSDPLTKTYEAAIRRVFQTQIDRGDKGWNRVSALLAAGSTSRDKAEDDAFAEANRIAKRRVNRDRIRLENVGAGLGGNPRTRAQLQRDEEQALLTATGLLPPRLELDENILEFTEFWHNGLVPIDVEIFTQLECETCSSRTTHFPTSPQGRRNILDSVCFCQLNRARAIGGAVCFMIANLRDQAQQNPDDQYLQYAMKLISCTFFRFFLREHFKVAPWCPESIVPATLAFLHDCRWLRSGAALLTQLALAKMPAVKGYPWMPAAVAHALTETLGRARMMRNPGVGVGPLLISDGVMQAAKMLKLDKSHRND